MDFIDATLARERFVYKTPNEDEREAIPRSAPFRITDPAHDMT